MKKRMPAFLTAAAMTVCMAAYLPASAETVTLSCAPLIQNMINIEVQNKNGDLVEGADLKLMDENGVCAAKFKSNTDTGTIMNQSGLKFVPYDDSEALIITSSDYAISAVPNGNRIIEISPDRSFYLSDNKSETIEIYHCNDNDVSTDYTLEEGSIAVYTHPAYHLKSSDGYIEVNDVKYNFKDSLSSTDRTTVYSVGELTSSCTFGAENSTRGAGGSVSLYPEEGTGEYFKVRMPITDLSDRFVGQRKYILPADVNGSGSDIAFDILNDSESNFACLAIISGSFVSAVMPDSDGYIEFYVDNATRSYTYAIECVYAYSDDEYVHRTSRSDEKTFLYADHTQVILSCPDFPETGTSFINVPAGTYTIEADSLPEGYVLSEPMEINVQDSEEVQNFTVVLEDYAEPSDPTEPAGGITVYPEDNIVNIIVKDYNGNLVTDAEMTLKGTNQRAAFNSGGTSFEKTSYTDFEWYENGLTEKSMWIPYKRFVEAAELENTFGMCFADEKDQRAYTGSFSMNSGETRAFNIFSKDDSVQADAVLEKGVMGLYTDPKWETNSAFTGYLLVNGEPVYINPDNSSSVYGAIRYIDVGTFTGSIYGGLCEPGTVPTSERTVLRPDITEENSEYIKVRCHIKEISEDFADNGTIAPNDYLVDPRNNKSSAKCMILIVSGGMMNAVIPDENGYVEFYADKNDRFARLDCYGSYTGAGFSSSFSVTGSYIAAESYTANYTAVTLPDTGVVLAEVPTGEYTLSFSSVSDEYRKPEDISFTVEEKTGIQTVEIILQQGYTLGDVDDNGKIEIKDASLVLDEYAGCGAGLESELTEIQMLAADVNEDSKVDISDATAILKYYAQQAAGIEPAW
ncbi:MAG: dockerin type I domain-containing protein [Ruminococcus sp.]